MKRYFIYNIFIITILFFSSCEKFLDVHPKSSISEKDLLTSEVGFSQALNGIYSQMASRELYGDNLSMGFVSALAQNYTATAHGFVFKETTALNYESSEVKNFTEQIWQTSYKAIAGINNILENIDSQESNFTANNFKLTKGESLGLRAYLHFELFRLFAPTYASGASKLSIPYRKEMNSYSQKPSTVEGFINQLINDLDVAEKLLENVDPIMQGDKDRRFNMNYLAVKALHARVLIYKGDKDKAYQKAKSVVDANVFSFVTNAQISAVAATKDRLFTNEQVFALRVSKMINWVESGTSSYFRYNTSMSSYVLTRTDANFATLYETTAGGATDYRFVYLLENDGPTRFVSKFWQTWSITGYTEKDRLDQTIPLIRFSELHYIMAESSSDLTEGIKALNTVRKNRGLADLAATITPTTLTSEIAKEYQKEFYAEGQLFYFYKRLNYQRMQFNTVALTEKSYVLPVPDSETEFNNQYN